MSSEKLHAASVAEIRDFIESDFSMLAK